MAATEFLYQFTNGSAAEQTIQFGTYDFALTTPPAGYTGGSILAPIDGTTIDATTTSPIAFTIAAAGQFNIVVNAGGAPVTTGVTFTRYDSAGLLGTPYTVGAGAVTYDTTNNYWVLSYLPYDETNPIPVYFSASLPNYQTLPFTVTMNAQTVSATAINLEQVSSSLSATMYDAYYTNATTPIQLSGQITGTPTV